MALGASYQSDLSHIESIIATLERIAKNGDSIASTSLINEPAYWRGRIEALLRRQDISGPDRKHAQAVMDRLHRVINKVSDQRETGQ